MKKTKTQKDLLGHPEQCVVIMQTSEEALYHPLARSFALAPLAESPADAAQTREGGGAPGPLPPTRLQNRPTLRSNRKITGC